MINNLLQNIIHFKKCQCCAKNKESLYYAYMSISSVYSVSCINGERVIIYPERVIRKGRQGNIVHGILCTTQQQVLIKLSHIFERGFSTGKGVEDKNMLMREADILHRLQGIVGIPTYFGITRIPLNSSQERIAIVMEYIRGLDIEQWRRATQKRLQPYQAIEFLYQAAHIFSHVHARGVVHCDIKMSNFIFTDKRKIAIVDWGAAQYHTANEHYERPNTVMGTVQFMSPEHI